MFIIRFLKRMINGFLDIYVDENQVRETYGDEYADRFAAVDPKTGKKTVSVSKILKRIVGVFIFALYLFLMIRIIF